MTKRKHNSHTGITGIVAGDGNLEAVCLEGCVYKVFLRGRQVGILFKSLRQRNFTFMNDLFHTEGLAPTPKGSIEKLMQGQYEKRSNFHTSNYRKEAN